MVGISMMGTSMVGAGWRNFWFLVLYNVGNAFPDAFLRFDTVYLKCVIKICQTIFII